MLPLMLRSLLSLRSPLTMSSKQHALRIDNASVTGMRADRTAQWGTQTILSRIYFPFFSLFFFFLLCLFSPFLLSLPQTATQHIGRVWN